MAFGVAEERGGHTAPPPASHLDLERGVSLDARTSASPRRIPGERPVQLPFPATTSPGYSNQGTREPLIFRSGDSSGSDNAENGTAFPNTSLAGRRRPKVELIVQLTFIVIFSSLVTFIILMFPPWKPEYRKYDPLQTYWALIWSNLALGHTIVLACGSYFRRFGHVQRSPSKARDLLLTGCATFPGMIWFVYGIKPLFWDPPYDLAAIRLARSLWLAQAPFYIIILFAYLLVCLCMPCILILLSRLRSPNLNVTPTPEWILSKLEVKKYKDLLDQLRRELGVYEVEMTASPPRGTSNGSTGGVSRLLRDAVTGSPPLAFPSVGGTNGGGLPFVSRGEPGRDPLLSESPEASAAALLQRLRLEKSCPICMADFEGSDDVMVMPCDKRHFFHVECVRQWLQGSQFCPICRANVVTLTTPPPQSPTELQAPRSPVATVSS